MVITKDRGKVTCVIPFYNESITTVISNVREVLKVKEIDYVVVVDDGSESIGNFEILRTVFINRSNISIIRLQNNSGKTPAIYHALKYVPDGNVFLCDSDLKSLDYEEISNAIIKYQLLDLNMLILRRLNIGFLPKIIRADTLLSGERILSKEDLIKVIQTNIKGYELEVAINQYFIDDNRLNCFWSPSSAVNNYKYKKFKFLKGIFKDLKMYFSIIKYVGFGNYINQVSSFCKQNV